MAWTSSVVALVMSIVFSATGIGFCGFLDPRQACTGGAVQRHGDSFCFDGLDAHVTCKEACRVDG